METSWLSSFKQRRGSWGLFILALLALVLAVWALANLLLLSSVVGMLNPEVSRERIWAVFLLNILFSLIFAASAYGLWTRRKWGRFLFIGSITVWTCFYIVSLFMSNSRAASGNYTFGALTINIIIYVVGAGSAIYYLNLAHIKALFDTPTDKSTK